MCLMCMMLTEHARESEGDAHALPQATASAGPLRDAQAGGGDQQARGPGTSRLGGLRGHHIVHGSLPGDNQSHVFRGSEHGQVPVSMFLVHNQPGDGPAVHRHPYAEVFVLHAGQARFVLDGSELLAGAGDILVAAAGAAHAFTNAGPGELRMTCVHLAAEMQTAWLDSAPQRTDSPDQPSARLPRTLPVRPIATAVTQAIKP